MKTVAHLKTLYLGRTETFIYNQIIGPRRFQSVVYATAQDNLEIFPVDRIFIPAAPPRWRRGAIKIWRRLLGDRDPWPWYTMAFAAACKRDSVDLLHCHFLEDATKFIWLAERTRLPFFVSCYGHDVASFPKEPGVKPKLDQVFRQAVKVIVLSSDMKQDVLALGCPEEKIAVRAQGVEIPERRPNNAPRTDGDTRLLCVASFVEKKGIIYLLEALAAVCSKNPDVTLTLIGDGPLRPQFEEYVAEHRLTEVVKMSGYVSHSEMLELMPSFDLFIHPSVTAADGDKEGIPTVILEAMAGCLPVISTRHAGIPEVIVNGENGILVGERDAKALAEAILRLIANRDERSRLGVAARATIEQNFSVSRQTKKLEAIYDSVLGDVMDSEGLED